MKVDPKGPEASRFRLRKNQVLRQFQLPDDLLPGSLTETHRRCGRANCHCAAADSPGHPIWFLTFMSDGKRRVERIPKEWVEDVRRQVEAGRAVQHAIKEMLAANAELLVLWRKQKGL
ncbi:MAG: DUF6788 family protein [Bryobacteraceae bacterium]